MLYIKEKFTKNWHVCALRIVSYFMKVNFVNEKKGPNGVAFAKSHHHLIPNLTAVSVSLRSGI